MNFPYVFCSNSNKSCLFSAVSNFRGTDGAKMICHGGDVLMAPSDLLHLGGEALLRPVLSFMWSWGDGGLLRPILGVFLEWFWDELLDGVRTVAFLECSNSYS